MLSKNGNKKVVNVLLLSLKENKLYKRQTILKDWYVKIAYYRQNKIGL